jgi:hypothetical protein
MDRQPIRSNDFNVCTSALSKRAFRAAPCNLLLQVTPENQDQALTEFKRVGELNPS